MINDEQKKKIKKLGAMIGLDAVISAFLSLFLSLLMAGKGVTANPIKYISYIYENGFPSDMFFLIFVVLALLIIYNNMQDKQELKKDEREFLYSKGGTYGTAQLLQTPDDISEVAKVEDAAHAVGTIFGQLDLSGNKIIDWDQFNKKNHRNKHVCVFGASSSGKTHCYVKPFCIQAVRRGESVVITDPKGELYEDTAAYFRDNGYVVRRLDLKNLSLSDGWDLLAEVRGDPDRAAILADVMWSNLGARDGSVFDKGPATLLKAMLLRVGLDDKYAAQHTQNIKTVYDMVQNPQGEAYLDQQFDVEKMDVKTRVSNKAYMAFKQGSDNLRGSLLTNLSAKMEVFQSDLVCKVLSTPDIDTTLPGKVKCAYFCMLPDMYSTYNFIGALFFSFLFLDLVDYADRQPGRRCKVPVNFLLDEFANIGSIPEFDKKLATVRSRALYINIILQDLPQLMNRYPQTYGSILSNCATLLCIGCNDPETAKYLSTRSGETTTQVRTDQHSGTDSLFVENKHSTGEGKRSIFTVDELMRFDMNECLIIWQAMNAMKAYKFPFDSHPDAKRMRNTDVMDYPSIEDEEGRKRLHEEEEKRIAEYNAKIASGWDPFAHFGAIHYDAEGKPIGEKAVDVSNVKDIVARVKDFIKKIQDKIDAAEKKTKEDALEDLRLTEVNSVVNKESQPVVEQVQYDHNVESFAIGNEETIPFVNGNDSNEDVSSEHLTVANSNENVTKTIADSTSAINVTEPVEEPQEQKISEPVFSGMSLSESKARSTKEAVESDVAGDEPSAEELIAPTTYNPTPEMRYGFDDEGDDANTDDDSPQDETSVIEVITLNDAEIKNRVLLYKNLMEKRIVLQQTPVLNTAIRKAMFGNKWETVKVDNSMPSVQNVDDFLMEAQNSRSQLSHKR